LALLSLFAFLRRIPEKTCKGCNDCAEICPMDAFGDDGCLNNEECTLCLDCIGHCPSKTSSFKLGKPGKKVSFDLNKRFFITWSVAGAVIPLVSSVSLAQKIKRPFLLRPPGVNDEQEFLSKCVRCGECMKVCVKNALQPALMESGFEGMFTPRLVPRNLLSGLSAFQEGCSLPDWFQGSDTVSLTVRFADRSAQAAP